MEKGKEKIKKRKGKTISKNRILQKRKRKKECKKN